MIVPEASTVATPPELLLQVPPGGEELSVLVEPWQMTVVPVMAPGLAFTVMKAVDLQPPGKM